MADRMLRGQEEYNRRVAEKGLPGINNPAYQRENIYAGQKITPALREGVKALPSILAGPSALIGQYARAAGSTIRDAYNNRPTYADRVAAYNNDPTPAPSVVQQSVPKPQPAPQSVGTLVPYPDTGRSTIGPGSPVTSGPPQLTRTLPGITTMDNPFDHPDPYPGRGGAVGGYGGYEARGAGSTLPNREGPRIAYLGGNPNDPLEQAKQRTSALFDAALNTNNGQERSVLLRQALASAQFARGVLDTQAADTISQRRNLTTRDIAQLESGDRNRISGAENQTRRDIAAANVGANLFDTQTRSNDNRYGVDARTALGYDTLTSDLPLQAAKTRYYDAEAATAGQSSTPSYSIGDLMSGIQDGSLDPKGNPALFQQALRAAGAGARTPDEQAFIMSLADQYFPQGGDQPKFAEGGLVSAVGGSLGSATPTAPPMASIQAYQQYADGARALGLPAVGFDKFMNLQQGAARTAGGAAGKGAMSFADGGMVPDASGKMVVDPNPSAPTDSIPAVIDNKQPAKLDSGEFVIPKDVVLFYGTDKLAKMIEKARNPEGSNGKSAVGATGG